MAYFKHVVIVKAEISYFDASFFEANIALCYLGAMIKDDVETLSMPIDMRIDLDPYAKFEKHLKFHKCDLVAISTMTASFPNALKLAAIAKKHGTYVVMGGYHPSALPGDVLNHEVVDAVVRGEGELVFRELVLNGPSKRVKGLSFKDKDGKLYHNEDQEKIEDLDLIPFPYRKLRPENPIFNKHEVIVTSRGCNGACTFCANNAVHGRWRGRSPRNVVEELKVLYEKNPGLDIHIWDANFMQDPLRIEKIIDLIKEEGIRFTYFCEMRVDHIVKYPRLIEGLAGIGMRWIAIGIESPYQETLKSLKKGITTVLVEKAIKILKENDIKVVGYLMIGAPGETADQMKEYPAYASKLGIDKIMLAIMTPHPGSQIFLDGQMNNTITSYDWEKYDIGHSVSKLQHMSNRECEVLMDWCWGKFYSPEWAFTRKNFFNLKKAIDNDSFSLKEGVYLYISYVWIGYPSFFIHARPRATVEENLKAYISAMEGTYDIGKYKFNDADYLDIMQGSSLQLTFHFSDGDDLSLIAVINEGRKFTMEIIKGRRDKMLFDFTINAVDYIDILRELPIQIPSLVNWGGYNLDNIKANIKVFKVFTRMVLKAIRLKSINLLHVPKYLGLGGKYFPKKIFDLLTEEFTFFSRRRKKEGIQGPIGGFTDFGKDILYKVMMLPFTTIVPVE